MCCPGAALMRTFSAGAFVLSAILVFLAVCATCLGGWAAVHLVEPVRNGALFRGFSELQLSPHLAVFGAVFFIYQFVFLEHNWLQCPLGTWQQSDGWLQRLLGRRVLVAHDCFLCFAWLQLRRPLFSLKRPTLSAWNLAVGGIVMACAGLNSLSGGREYALDPFVVCAAGTLFSSIGWRALAKLCVLALPIPIALMIVIGSARDSSSFAGGWVPEKLSPLARFCAKARPPPRLARSLLPDLFAGVRAVGAGRH